MTISPITFHPAAAESLHHFSIVIPTWNNLPHLQLLVRSIREHSRYQHQIVVHVNEGSDGTRQWVEQQKFSYSYSKENVGVCFAFNAAVSLAKSDFLLLIDDDNYLLPDWDFYLWQEVEKIGHPYFSVSATKIEPRKTFNPCVIAPEDFGHSPDTFRESELLAQYKNYEHADWNGSMRVTLLECAGLNWSRISPAIFGALFQSAMDAKARRNLGAHYTSEANILKLIKPLFLDELWEEFQKNTAVLAHA